MPIKASRINRQSSLIDGTRNDAIINENKRKHINFTFKYFMEDSDFHINHPELNYLQTVIRRLQEVCRLSFTELVVNNSRAWRFHRIDWFDDKVSRSSFKIPKEEDLYDEVYQFSISGNEHGRIVGFFTEGRTFNVVWFDKDHRLYP